MNPQTPSDNFNVIVAIDKKGGISENGKIPWRDFPLARSDMTWFVRATSDYTPADTNYKFRYNNGNRCVYFGDNFIKRAVIMGRKTWESLPNTSRPLPNRYNIVLSRNFSKMKPQDQVGKGWEFVGNFDDALRICNNLKMEAWVIGGEEIYNLAINHPRLGRIYVSDIERERHEYKWNCDTFFPIQKIKSLDNITSAQVSGHPNLYDPFPYFVNVYSIGSGSEKAYLDLLQELIDAPVRPNRTGIPTHGVFARTLRFNLFDIRGAIMPLLTTKKMSFKLVLSELLWFLSGSCTDTSYLHEHNNHIWDGNTTREFLDSRGLTEWKPGQTGAIYGFQWRHWNGSEWFRNESGDTNNLHRQNTPLYPGIDQFAKVIQTLKTDPWDRRMIVSAWNPQQLNVMALPPCHWSFQFHVDQITDVVSTTESASAAPKFILNCCMNMRSADMALGVPFNIASYATLVHIIAYIVNMQPGELVINMTDCHIYQNHINGIKTQLQRTPRQFPTFKFGPKITAIPRDKITIDDFAAMELDQFIVENYDPYPAIKLEMAV